jgi:hypothetical protein
MEAALVLMAAVGAANLAGVASMWRAVFDPVEMLAGRESARAFLERKMLNSYCGLAAEARARLVPGDRVAIVGETRGLYWSVPFFNHSVYDVGLFEEAIRSSADSRRAAGRLKQKGVTYLFFNDVEASRMKFRFEYPMLEFDSREHAVVAELWSRWIEGVAGGPRGGALYRLLRRPRRASAAPALPLCFDDAALRREFEGVTEITWSGGGQIQAIKSVVK